MTKIKIGIDFSINSTAVTINNNDKFIFYVFVPNYNKKLKRFSTHETLLNDVNVISYKKLENITKEQIDINRIKINNAHNLSNVILNKIYEHVNKSSDVMFLLEGFSYGSKGNSFIDLIMFNSIFRSDLTRIYGYDSLYIIPPKTLKKQFTGNGNANKFDMINSFQNLNLNLNLNNTINKLELTEKSIKPIDDIIDSFALSTYNLV